MDRRNFTIIIVFFFHVISLFSDNYRNSHKLENNWKFQNSDVHNAHLTDFDDSKWETVTVPHDWAITGPFDRNNDLHKTIITQNLETVESYKTGRTGGLPYMGVGWYRNQFDIDSFDPNTKKVTIMFDGAMSEATVYINGHKAIFWPYGYSLFHCDITDYINQDGRNNIVAVRLENKPESSRWYPGAGLYRNVHVITTNKTHVPVWGTFVTTNHISDDYASIKVRTEISNNDSKFIRIVTNIKDENSQVVSSKDNTLQLLDNQDFEQNFIIDNPKLWTPDTPNLYYAESTIYVNDVVTDTYSTTFGIRDIKFIPDKGFFLNNEVTKIKGVCNHHDLGPLGAAINESALRHQISLLKDMGCNAIRTSHNIPAPELVKLCDEMGIMLMIEPFDEWDIAKSRNGYHRFFGQWVEKDLTNMVRAFRNSPSVIMWSTGNEVPTQCTDDGYKMAVRLQSFVKGLDTTRPIVSGMDQLDCVLHNGFASVFDIPGLNYRAHRYEEAYTKLPQNIIMGCETASTVSSRGVYKFPVEKKADAMYDDHQCSSYDLEYCGWSNTPDDDFANAEDLEWSIGQFVWTGFDYLGEPTPYGNDSWPNHSSMFGIIDLASLPKDRYYLYRSVWNDKQNTLHILPHWTWMDRIGENTPVFVYTNHPSAELFINGKSQGIQKKSNQSNLHRFRLMWMDTTFEPGELKVVAYNHDGEKVDVKTIHTADKPNSIELKTTKTELTADGKDLSYITIKVVDKDGNLCPHENRKISFSVKGAGVFRAVANGDPTNLEAFHLPEMHTFNGMLTMIVQSSTKEGDIIVNAKSKGLKSGTLRLTTNK